MNRLEPPTSAVPRTTVPRQRHRPRLRGEISLPMLFLERGLQMAQLYRNWPMALADRTGLRRRDRRVIYRLKSSVGTVELLARTNGSDVRTINEIWIGELNTRFINESFALHRPFVVVDIGANCGYFAVYAGRRFPGARIVCFEPDEDNRTLALANLALNGVEAEVHPEAVVSEDVDLITLNLSTDPRLHTTVPLQSARSHGIDTARYDGPTASVPAVEVNRALAPLATGGRIDLLKIDVEGLELDLLSALSDFTLAAISCISAEVGDRDSTSVTRRLRDHGFSITHDAGLLLATRTREGGGGR